MRFAVSALTYILAIGSLIAALSLPTDSISILRRDNECDGGPYASRYDIGGPDGVSFCEVYLRSSGELLQELEVWSDEKGIRGISFTFSSGKTAMHGDQGKGQAATMKLAPGELVSAARLWGNGKGQHLGHIYLKTDKQEFDVGMPKPNDGYPIEVGGGLLLGASGLVGDDYITSLCLIFLKAKIDRVQIGDVKFDADPTGTSDNISPVYLIQSTFGNPNGSTGNISFTVAGSQQVVQTTTWDQATTGKFGGSMSVAVKAAPFGVGATFTGEYKWSVDHKTSHGGSNTESVTITNTVGPMVLTPGHGKECKIFSQKGEGDFPYTSTVRIMLEGGGEVAYKEKGSLKSVQFSDTKASCVDANNPIDWEGSVDSPPKGVNVVEDSR